MPDTLLHLYGHLHGFTDHKMKGTRMINVSVLDLPVSARPRRKRKWTDADCKNFNAGTYTIIEISVGGIAVESLTLPHDYTQWIPINARHNGIAWIPEEQEWTDQSDPQLLRYSVSVELPKR